MLFAICSSPMPSVFRMLHSDDVLGVDSDKHVSRRYDPSMLTGLIAGRWADRGASRAEPEVGLRLMNAPSANRLAATVT